jgi:hypothetical protein
VTENIVVLILKRAVVASEICIPSSVAAAIGNRSNDLDKHLPSRDVLCGHWWSYADPARMFNY